MYWNTNKTIVLQANFDALASCMNSKSTTLGEQRTSINLSQLQLNTWFIKYNGKQFSPKEKPLYTPIHKTQTLLWVRTHHFKLNNLYIVIAYLNDKFLTTNRRHKVKKLPLEPLKNLGHFLRKAIFMYVVGRPIPHSQFNGKIF